MNRWHDYDGTGSYNWQAMDPPIDWAAKQWRWEGYEGIPFIAAQEDIGEGKSLDEPVNRTSLGFPLA